MEADFDIAAMNYDTYFSNSKIGILQRNIVYSHLKKHLCNCKSVLEINCGTGEDAIWLAKQNLSVLATDISEKMIEVAKSKTELAGLHFSVMDINSIESLKIDSKVDLVFSNFGGLNCLSTQELISFFSKVGSVMEKKGKITLVLMPKNTLWEKVYFSLKLRFKEVFRRQKTKVLANVDGIQVETYYYNPKDIISLANEKFNVLEIKPIGFFIPPSYLEPFFRKKIRVLNFLNKLEQKVKNWSFLAKYADHYIITLYKK